MFVSTPQENGALHSPLQPRQRERARRRWPPIVALLIGLVTVTFLFLPVAASATTALVTGTEWVFVRRGPGNQFPPFARIPSGSTVEVQEIEGDWARIVTANGQVGFIHKKFLSFPSGGEQPPHRTEPRPAASPTPTHGMRGPTLRVPEATRAAPTIAAFPAHPTYTHPPTTTPPRSELLTVTPTRTRRPTRTPPPSRTPSLTRTPTVTRTTTATRSPTPTRSPVATRTEVSAAVEHPPGSGSLDVKGTATPAAPASPAATRASVEELEAELLAVKQELLVCRQQNSHAPTLASCPEEIKVELARLREALEVRAKAATVPLPAAPEPGSAAAADQHAVSPLVVFVGTAGLILGWWGGTRYARRRERSRQLRLRF